MTDEVGNKVLAKVDADIERLKDVIATLEQLKEVIELKLQAKSESPFKSLLLTGVFAPGGEPGPMGKLAAQLMQ